ncbi:hypothetical protein [Poseidonocella sedimentorum]|uniref:Uncharacterized protein n=1 Tax=Poseidonocella sedimentorum TaxID=871652 RepID=A0A1I6DFB8_9RHOB|nr:hypothetical protein [Poseidonocella sedimentorum]SFR04143.1 hypothetical protein SAMN04515673_103124 [Poseidonocella sedimentorum]
MARVILHVGTHKTGIDPIHVEEPPVVRESVSVRAARWFMTTKHDGTALDTSALRARWVYALSDAASPLLTDAPRESLWASAEQRDAVFAQALDGFTHNEFWDAPSDEITPLIWTADQQAEVEAHYADWFARSETWLKFRKHLGMAPYQKDETLSAWDKTVRYGAFKLRSLLQPGR